MTSPLTRRALLKSIGLIGLSTATVFAPDALQRALAQEALPPLPRHWNGEPLGRITGDYMNLRAEPSLDADVAGTLEKDAVVRIQRAIEGQSVFFYNNLWLETTGGYLFSSFVQPVRYHLPQPPRADLGAGMWAEVIVPFTDARLIADENNPDAFHDRLYYSSVLRVTGLETGRDGKAWYISEELYQSYYVRASHVRLIPREALAPLSPDLLPAEKRITIDLTAQTMTAYERDIPVFQHYVATGLPDFETPTGTYYVVDKRPGDRMTNGLAGSEEEEGHYNLGGVPFVSYFTWDWVAFHGCYWHNDYGRQHSHGCVNIPPDVARWVWRWTTPVCDYDSFYVRPENGMDGTKVYVK